MTDQQSDDRAFIEELTEALLQGRKIEAIKLYRERTGCGLAEAKEEVETLAADLKARHPDQFPDRPKRGCAGVLMQIALALLMTWCLTYCAIVTLLDRSRSAVEIADLARSLTRL